MLGRVSLALAILYTFSAALAQDMAQPQPVRVMKNPKFCRKLKCPAFAVADEVNENEMRLQTRMYVNSTQWVMTEMEVGGDVSWWSRMWNNYEGKLFSRLFGYISGENEWRKEINMTAPVLIRYESLGNGRTKISMFFYVALPKVPKPTNPAVSLYTHPAKSQVLVRSFETLFITFPWKWDENVNKLKNDVERANSEMPQRFMEVNRRVFYHVGYDGPFVFSTRHNEVWMEPAMK